MNEAAYSTRHADLRMDTSVTGLDQEDAQTDLERMGVSHHFCRVETFANVSTPSQLREPVRQPTLYPFDSAFGHTLNNTGLGNLRMAPNHLAMPFGYPSYEPPHFLPSLPPLPSTLPPRMDYNHNASRPLSNPRVTTYPKDSPATPIHRNSPSSRGYPNTQYASAFDQEVDRMQGQWPKVASQQSMQSPYQYDEQRRTASGVSGSSDAMDTSADHQSRQLEETPLSSIKENSSGTNASRFTLDAHMARSPKASPKVPATITKVEATRNSPSFMSIPAFVPHHSQLPHQHLQPVVHAAVLPALPSLPTPATGLEPSPSISSQSSSSLPSLPNLPPLPQVAPEMTSPTYTAAVSVVPIEKVSAAEIQVSSMIPELPIPKATALVPSEPQAVLTAPSQPSSTADVLPLPPSLEPLANGIISPSIPAIPSPSTTSSIEVPAGQSLFPYYTQAIPERPAPPPALSAQSSTG